MKICEGDLFEYTDYFGNKIHYIAVQHLGSEKWSMLGIFFTLKNKGMCDVYLDHIPMSYIRHFSKLNHCSVQLPNFNIP